MERKRMVDSFQSWAALEDELANMPGVWWPEVDMVERLETACSLVIIHLVTTVFSPSTTFIINNLLPLLSKVMESQLDCVPDHNVNQLLNRILTAIKSQPLREISSLLRNIKFKIH